MKSTSPNDLGKFLVEECQSLDIGQYVKGSKERLKKEFIKTQLLIDDIKVQLSLTLMPNGGFRYWFKCPHCNQRVGKLYKHPINGLLACRNCNNLDYRSRRYKGMVETEL